MDDFEEMKREMRSQLRWTVGILLTMWASIILTIFLTSPKPPQPGVIVLVLFPMWVTIILTILFH